MELNVELWLGVRNIGDLGMNNEGVIKSVTKEKNLLAARDGKEKEDLVLHVDIANMTYKIRANMTSTINLVKAFGRNTDAWVGKRVIVGKGMVKGREALIVTPKA
jgi:hypothetical protein